MGSRGICFDGKSVGLMPGFLDGLGFGCSEGAMNGWDDGDAEY